MLFKRLLKLSEDLESSIFLFGARQTGKSTFLRQQFPHAIYIDLLDTQMKSRFHRRPFLLYEMLRDEPRGRLVIIDEIPEVPELLNEVHRLISEFGLVFILCGSSARKLKRKGHNTLGGRAYPLYFFPFVSQEIDNFNLDKALSFGMIPSHYLSSNPQRQLSAYVDVYLREEIKEESLVRNLSSFHRFLEVAAITSGEMINYNNIAQECGVSSTTVKSYYDILEETLVGYRIPAYTKTNQRRVVQSPRFYYFDVGITNYLRHQKELTRGTVEYGHAFEHFIVQEIMAYLNYSESDEKMSYWRTYTGIEVDILIGDARVAIEVKSAEEILSKHLKGLKAFGEEYPNSRRIVVSLDIFNRRVDDIECIYVMDFLKMLWRGEL